MVWAVVVITVVAVALLLAGGMSFAAKAPIPIAEVQRNKDLNVGISGSAGKKTKRDTVSG